ncbi:MAG: hypothetical protein ACHQ9S_13105 [Candidatus Binatia bacterium]
MPRLLGTYELELHPAIETLCALSSTVIVNIGAAEGYYAVGMALQNPQAKIFAYDIVPYPRFLQKQLAQLNGVTDRTIIRKECTWSELMRVLDGAYHPIVICDCEGAEDDLLRPDQVGLLRETAVLVELHDFIRPGVSERIGNRFSDTHHVETIKTQRRTARDLPTSIQLPEREAKHAMDEKRKREMQWYLMLPRAV